MNRVTSKDITLGLAFFVLAVGILSLLFPGLPAKAARKDAAWVNNNVRWQSPASGSARPTVVGWENDCTDELRRNKQTMPDNTETQRRAIVNASAYFQSVWLSRRNDPRNINNTPVAAGSPVQMQVNDLVFLCAIITMNASGFNIDPDHRVTNTQYPNDRDPVPDSPASQYRINQASRYESNSRIYDVRVVSGPGSISNKPIGDILGYRRDNDSRYWRAQPIPFTYNSPANLPSGTYRVEIEFEYATIQTYHAYGSDGVSRCRLRTSGEGANVPYNAFSRCDRGTATYVFFFTINQPIPESRVFPSSQHDKPGNKMTYPETATFSHFVNVNGGGIAGSVGWRIQRYRNGTPTGGVATGTYTVGPNGSFQVGGNRLFNATAADVGDRICERLQLVSPNNVVIAASPSNPSEACLEVVARPYLTAVNNDVWAGGNFDVANNKCAGMPSRLSDISSWASATNGAKGEYGVAALGPITEFGSANVSNGDDLSFANVPGLGSFGAPTRCIPNYFAQIGTTGATPIGNLINLSALPGGPGKHTYLVTGDAAIIGGTLPSDKQAIILATGNIRILEPYSYDNTYTGKDDIASLWLVSQGNIYIEADVDNISGLLVAPGKLHTCVVEGTTAPPAQLSPNNCNVPLTVFGAIVADQVYWQRTIGTVGPGPAAENIIFDPGLYLNSPFTGAQGGVQSGDVEDNKELPPIY